MSSYRVVKTHSKLFWGHCTVIAGKKKQKQSGRSFRHSMVLVLVLVPGTGEDSVVTPEAHFQAGTSTRTRSRRLLVPVRIAHGLIRPGRFEYGIRVRTRTRTRTSSTSTGKYR